MTTPGQNHLERYYGGGWNAARNAADSISGSLILALQQGALQVLGNPADLISGSLGFGVA